MGKLTLKEKKLLNEYVTGETKRCLSLIKEAITALKEPEAKKTISKLYDSIILESPFLEFNQELKKRLISK
jgi:hypothetical protein